MLQELPDPIAKTAKTAETPEQGSTRILLGEAASQALLAAGEECWMIAGKSSHPEQPGRVVLHLVPVSMAVATAACRVVQGTHRAVKIKAPAETEGTAVADEG